MIVYRKLAPYKLTGSADISDPLSVTTAFAGQDWVLSGVYLKFSAGVTETFTVTLSSASGANYACVFKTESLTGATSASYLPSAPLLLAKGDEVTVGVTSATATGTVYYTIVGYEA